MNSTVKGSFLIAAPQLSDPNFSRTVVLVAEHNEQGSFGLVLNRPAQVKVADLWSAISSQTCRITSCAYLGGPVQTSAVFLLHTCDDLADGAEPVVPGVYLGNDVELMGALIERERRLRQEGSAQEIVRVYCGYSGWGESQLDRELATGSWIVQPASADFVFSRPAEGLWERAMSREGGIYRIFSLMPPDPEMN